MLNFYENGVRNTVWRYYAYNFFKSLTFFSAVLVPFFTDWGQISLFQAQLLQSWFMLWIFLLEVPTGAVADYFGRKYSLALGALVVTFGALIYGSIPKFEVFLFSEFLFALCFALISGADDALLYDTLKDSNKQQDSKKYFGRAHSFELLGILVSAPLGSLIASKFSLNTPMQFTAIPFLIATIIAWSIPEPKRCDKQSEQKRYLEIAKKGFLFFYHHKTLRILAFDAILVASAGYFVIWLYQPLLKSLNIPISFFGSAHAILVGTEILIASNFVRLEKMFGSAKALLRFTAIITGIMFLITAAYPTLITILLFIILAGGFGLTRIELMVAYMNDHIPSEQRATVLSSISMFRRFALVVLNPLVGFAADHSLRLALLLVGLLPLTVFLFSPLKQQMLGEKRE